MIEVFDEEKYSFTDSIIEKIGSDKNMLDYLIVIDYFLGQNESSIITLRLKNVKKFDFTMNYEGRKDDVTTPYTIANISKKKKGKLVEFIVESSLSFLPTHQNDAPLIRCLCEDVYIEK